MMLHHLNDSHKLDFCKMYSTNKTIFRHETDHECYIQILSLVVHCTMFHKEYSFLEGVSSSSSSSKKKAKMDVPLRKSDRRKLRDLVANCFPTAPTSVVNAIFLQDSLVVRKVVLPGAKVQLYLRSPSSSPNGEWPYTTTTECVWMTLDRGPHQPQHECPSVATLSVLYSLDNNDDNNANYPTVVVQPSVSKFLCRGANLMRAGVRGLSAFSSSVPIVAVRVQGNPQPFAVGCLTEGTNVHTVGMDTKGVAVEIFQCYGDDVWKNTTATATAADKAAVINPVGGAPFANGHYGNVGFLNGKLVSPIRAAVTDDDDDDDELPDDVAEAQTTTEEAVENAVQVEETTDSKETTGGDDEKEAAPQEVAEDNDDEDDDDDDDDEGDGAAEDPRDRMDELLHASVCKALVHLKDRDLPMITSTFYAQHVLAHRPPDTTIDLKATSYKKFGAYLKHQVDRNLLQVQKQGTNPTGFLKAINRRHDDLRGVRKDPKTPNDDDKDDGKKIKQKLVSLYMVPHHFVALLRLDPDQVKAVDAKSDDRRGTGMLTLPETREILNNYLQTNELIKTSSSSSSEVQLDGPLTDALYGKSNRQSAPNVLSMKDVSDKWKSKMEAAYALVEMPGSKILRLARGNPPRVSIEVLRRSTKKFVTRVRGLEEYGMDAADFCREVSRRFALSGAVETEPTEKLKKGHVELIFQGHLSAELSALLLGDERLTSHGGAKNSPYCLPKQSLKVTLRKGVPAKKGK